MSAPLPHFQRGETLSAAKLNAVIARVRELQAKQPSGGTVLRRARRIEPCRHYAFELAELNGVIYYRQGWVDPGTGVPFSVGEREWNPLGSFKPCTVWLEISGSGPTSCEAIVIQDVYDDSTPETNLRRRLGYVREVKDSSDENAAPAYACIQVCGGLISPCAPRRCMGPPGIWDADLYCKDDYSWESRAGGVIYGAGYECEDRTYTSFVVFGFSCKTGQLSFPEEHGGIQHGLYIDFNAGIW